MKFYQRLILLFVIWLVCFLPWVILASLAGTNSTLVLLVSAVLVPLYVEGSMRVLRHGPDWLAFASMQWLGLSAIAFPLALPAWLLSFWFASEPVLIIYATGWALLVLLAVYKAHRIHDVHREISDHRIGDACRIVQISDVHVGSRSPRFLQKVVDRVNGHTPDIVLITGDLLDLGRIGVEELGPLSSLNAPAYMCIGNHERYVDLERALSSVSEHGVIILRDEQIRYKSLSLIGIDDHDEPLRVRDVLSRLSPADGLFHILLYHRPDAWAIALEFGIPLMLSGHTHNGQIWPFGLLVKRRFRQVVGWHEAPGGLLHVSSGTGTWGPTMRLGTRCEMAVLDLRPVVV